MPSPRYDASILSAARGVAEAAFLHVKAHVPPGYKVALNPGPSGRQSEIVLTRVGDNGFWAPLEEHVVNKLATLADQWVFTHRTEIREGLAECDRLDRENEAVCASKGIEDRIRDGDVSAPGDNRPTRDLMAEMESRIPKQGETVNATRLTIAYVLALVVSMIALFTVVDEPLGALVAITGGLVFANLLLGLCYGVTWLGGFLLRCMPRRDGNPKTKETNEEEA